jgi:putative Mn2+ efflux pump MntP
VTFEYVIANSLGFYGRFEYYDKFQHALIPTITSFIGMLLVYIGYRFGKFKASYILSWGIIVFITIGLGGIIEVSEYIYDQIIGPATNFYISQGVLTQGSPLLDPFTDTMTDLILDIVGALIGATFGLWLLIRHEKKRWTITFR